MPAIPSASTNLKEPWATLFDIFNTLFFILAFTPFLGLLVAGPIGFAIGLGFVFLSLILRLSYVSPTTFNWLQEHHLAFHLRYRPSITRKPHTCLIFLGSGGHTTEMLCLLEQVKTTRCKHRVYLISSGDNHSAKLASEFEEKLSSIKSFPPKGSMDKFSKADTFAIEEVPRARKVGQSWLTTPFTCIITFWVCIKFVSGRALHSGKPPSLIITNGPASACMVVFASFWRKFWGSYAARIIYVESITRVKSLSLTGKLVKLIANRFIVWWPAAKTKNSNAELIYFSEDNVHIYKDDKADFTDDDGGSGAWVKIKEHDLHQSL